VWFARGLAILFLIFIIIWCLLSHTKGATQVSHYAFLLLHYSLEFVVTCLSFLSRYISLVIFLSLHFSRYISLVIFLLLRLCFLIFIIIWCLLSHTKGATQVSYNAFLSLH
jgi:hypothetical protein